MLQSEQAVFFVLSLPHHDFETSVRFHFRFHFHDGVVVGGNDPSDGG